MNAKRFVVHGRVQGVGFRYSTRMVADKLNLNGWCRNCVDGTVEVCVGGDPADVEQMHNWLLKGPRGACVERVESDPVNLGQQSGFQIFR